MWCPYGSLPEAGMRPLLAYSVRVVHRLCLCLTVLLPVCVICARCIAIDLVVLGVEMPRKAPWPADSAVNSKHQRTRRPELSAINAFVIQKYMAQSDVFSAEWRSRIPISGQC